MKWLICVPAAFLLPGLLCPASRARQGDTVPATEQITTPAVPEPVQSQGIVAGMLAKSSESGNMTPDQVKALLDQERFVEFRINDLMTDLHPDRWKMSDAARNSFSQTIATMRSQMDVLKGWRTEFLQRPESMGAGFRVYATIGAILPRLEGVARTITQVDNPSFGAQFDDAAGRLFDMQQKLAPYIGFLLQNQDSLVFALENNLAGCQTDLGHALKGQGERPKWMKNSAPVRAKRTRVKSDPSAAGKGLDDQRKPDTTQPPKNP
jgi:hypothetical protein